MRKKKETRQKLVRTKTGFSKKHRRDKFLVIFVEYLESNGTFLDLMPLDW